MAMVVDDLKVKCRERRAREINNADKYTNIWNNNLWKQGDIHLSKCIYKFPVLVKNLSIVWLDNKINGIFYFFGKFTIIYNKECRVFLCIYCNWRWKIFEINFREFWTSETLMNTSPLNENVSSNNFSLYQTTRFVK